MKTLSFVIPVYRNAGTIRGTYEGILSVIRPQEGRFEVEFVFVDDGSDDGSQEELEALHRSSIGVRVLFFSRNFGQVPAIVAGLREASGDLVVVMSADMQDPPDLVLRMVADWEAGADVVVCYRQRRHDTRFSWITSRLFYGLVHLVNPRMPTTGFDFLLLSRQAVTHLNSIDERNRFLQGDVLWIGLKTTFIPYERQRREVGVSQWTLAKKVKYFLDGLLSTSYWPIRAMSLIGIATATAGFLYALVIVYVRLIHKTPFVGWAPLMIVTLLVGGLNMIMLGVIGEYVWRTYDEARGRASYIVTRRLLGSELRDEA